MWTVMYIFMLYVSVSICVCVIQYLDEGLKYCNYFFTLVFVIESTLKLVAFGFRRFFKERWGSTLWTPMHKLCPSGNLTLFRLCQVESVGSGYRSSLHHGNHSGRDRPECFSTHQPHDHTHHEGAADSQRYRIHKHTCMYSCVEVREKWEVWILDQFNRSEILLL